MFADSLLSEERVTLTLESIQEYSPADDQYYSDVRLIGGKSRPSDLG